MIRTPAIVISVLVLTAAPVQAQTPPPTTVPWPPDPATIFADGVRWEAVLATATDTDTVPSPYIDNENRMIRVYDTVDTWTEYSFPEGKNYLYDTDTLPDGRIRVWTRRDESNLFRFYGIPADAVLILDPATETYAVPPLVCNDQVVQEPTGQGRWVPIRTPGTYDEFACFCHTTTSEQIDNLPDGFFEWRIAPSPDGRWLALAGKNLGQIQMFSYEIDTGMWETLGTTDNWAEWFGFGIWVSSTRGTLGTGWSMSSSATIYYAFDVTQPDSFQEIFYVWYDDLFPLEDRPGYAAFFAEPYAIARSGALPHEHRNCELTFYDAQGVRRYELADDCLPMVTGLTDGFAEDYAPAIRFDNTLYYLTTSHADPTVSELRSFDLVTETGNTRLWTAEIEAILGVSPDHRYVVVLTDENEALDKGFRDCCREHGGWQVLIFDQEENRPIYLSEPIGVYVPQQTFWLTPSTLVISAAQVMHPIRDSQKGGYWPLHVPASLRRIEIGDEGIEVALTTRFGSPPSLNQFPETPSPDNHYALLDDAVVDLSTFESHPIVRDDISPAYKVVLRWSKDGDPQARISTDGHPGQWLIYRLTLAQ